MVELISAEQRQQAIQALPQFEQARQQYSQAESQVESQLAKLQTPRIQRTISDLNALRKVREAQSRVSQQKSELSSTKAEIEKSIPELERLSKLPTPEEYQAEQQRKIELAQKYIDDKVPYKFIDDPEVRAMVKQGYAEMNQQRELANSINTSGIPSNIQEKIDAFKAKGLTDTQAFSKATGLRIIPGKSAGDQEAVNLNTKDLQIVNAPNSYSTIVTTKDLNQSSTYGSNGNINGNVRLSGGTNILERGITYIRDIIGDSSDFSTSFNKAKEESYSKELGGFVSASRGTGGSGTVIIRPIETKDISKLSYPERVKYGELLPIRGTQYEKYLYPTKSELVGFKVEDLIKKGTNTIINTFDKFVGTFSYQGDKDPIRSMTLITEPARGMSGKGTVMNVDILNAERRGILNIEQQRALSEQRIELKFNLENQYLNQRYVKGEIPYDEYVKNLKALQYRTNQDLEKVNKEYTQKATLKQIPYTFATSVAIGAVSTAVPIVGWAFGGLSLASAVKNRKEISSQFKLAPKETTANILAGIAGGFAGAKGVSYLKTPVRVRLPSAKYQIQEVSTVGKAKLDDGQEVKTLNILSTKYVPEQFASEQPRWKALLDMKPKTAVRIADDYTLEARTNLFDFGEEYKGITFVGKQGGNLRQIFDVTIPKSKILPLTETPRSPINIQLLKEIVGDMQVIPKEAAEKIFSSMGIAERIGRANLKTQDISYLKPETSYTRVMTIGKPLENAQFIKETSKQIVSIPIEGERYYFASRTTTYPKPIGSTINPLVEVRNSNIFPAQLRSRNIEFGKGTLITRVPEEAKLIKIPKPEKVPGQPELPKPVEIPEQIAIQRTAEKVTSGLLKSAPVKLIQPKAIPVSTRNVAVSSFAGTGQYERTNEQSFPEIIRMQNKNLDIVSVPTKFASKIIQTSEQQQKDNLIYYGFSPKLQVLSPTQEVRNKDLLGIAFSFKQNQVLRTKEESKLLEKNVLSTKSEQTAVEPEETPVRIRIPSKKKFLPPSANLLGALKKAFDVVVFKGGKEVVIGKSLPEGRAKKLGVENILSTLRASFKLKPKGFTSQEDINYKLPDKLFTTAKRDASRFVQKKETRLKGRPEIREILGVRKSKRGGKFKWW